ncbi:hypothetical protein ASF84_28170 [Pseudomonas sp. Leaf127]|nr:hypothetical protein ASF84_28170 [Pseudomonas sp. Leaf127]
MSIMETQIINQVSRFSAMDPHMFQVVIRHTIKGMPQKSPYIICLSEGVALDTLMDQQKRTASQ